MRTQCIGLTALVLLGAAAVHGEETLLYRAAWGDPAKGLDGWTADAAEALAEPALGATLRFQNGASSPTLTAPGNHLLRVRYVLRKPHGHRLGVSAVQYAGGKQLDQTKVGGYYTELARHDPPAPDPTAAEVGILTEPEADAVVIRFGTSGPAGQPSSVSGFQVFDLGPPPEVPVADKEFIEDGGWENRRPREVLPPENSYGIGTWMGWGARALLMVTRRPGGVHSGQQALLVRPDEGGMSGFRAQHAIKTVPGAWYDFSVWAKGEGTIQLYFVADFPAPSVLLAPDEWRQLHLVYCADNPAKKGFSTGCLMQGQVFVDDLSVRQITAEAARTLLQTANRWPTPARIVQTVPPGEMRGTDEVVLENAYLQARLSPVGGGHIVELTDKQRGVVWRKTSLLNLVFPNQPVPVEWALPFATMNREAGQVTFAHTVTGGAAAVFLDGVRIEQTFSLGPDDRAVSARFRLTNTGPSRRLPNPAVLNRWDASTGINRVACSGEEGLISVTNSAVATRNLAGPWMAGSGANGSLVWTFDVTSVQDGMADPAGRRASWSYMRVVLPPGGAWETRAALAAVALPAVDYADATVAVQVGLTRAQAAARPYELAVGCVPLSAAEPRVVARIADYGGMELVRADAGRTPMPFTPPAGRFVTALDITTAGARRTVELFNDPRARDPQVGIEGAGQVQYRPTVPIRVLRLSDVGDLTATLGQSRSVLWAKGLFFQYYPMEAVLAQSGYAVESLDGGAGFPEELEELAAFRAVILSNVGAIHLSPPARAALAQYVRAGGRLLVMGGSMGLGNALTTGTDLEDLLPATLSGPYDVQPCPGRRQVLRPAVAMELPWQDRPCLYWMHTVRPRPGSTIVAAAGKTPVALDWACGQGRVFLFAGTVEGDPRPGETPAWEWRGWPAFWSAVWRRLGA